MICPAAFFAHSLKFQICLSHLFGKCPFVLDIFLFSFSFVKSQPCCWNVFVLQSYWAIYLPEEETPNHWKYFVWEFQIESCWSIFWHSLVEIITKSFFFFFGLGHEFEKTCSLDHFFINHLVRISGWVHISEQILGTDWTFALTHAKGFFLEIDLLIFQMPLRIRIPIKCHIGKRSKMHDGHH